MQQGRHFSSFRGQQGWGRGMLKNLIEKPKKRAIRTFV